MVENDQVLSALADEVNAAHAALHRLGAGGPRPRPVAVAGRRRAVGAAGAAAGDRRPIKFIVVLVAMVPVLLLASCGDQNACDHPPAGIGAVATDVQASTDPCVGQLDTHILAWFTRQGTRYPLRCGRRHPRGFGYLHIRYDEGGHGDPVNDATFRAEMVDTLEHGTEHLASRWNVAVHPEVQRRQGRLLQRPVLSRRPGPIRQPARRLSGGHHHRPVLRQPAGPVPIIEGVMAQAARSGIGRAGELVAALQGWEFPESNIVLDEISSGKAARNRRGGHPPKRLTIEPVEEL